MGKKALSWGVVATTIAWSMGVATVAAPLVANAAVTMPAGSLVKGSLKAVYYVGTDGKRHAFPDAKVYMSWYPDFSGVTTISDSDLGSIPLSGINVVHRSGAYLVKINTVPTVYAIEPGGVLRGISSEAVASALWGSGWATRVRDVDDSVFGNYTLGADITSNTYPTGSLVKTASSPDIYYIDGTSKRKVTADGFTANRFRMEFVVTTSLDLSVYTNGTDVSVGETQINDTAQLGGGGSGTVGTGSGLTLAAASDNPVAVTIVDDFTGNTGGQALIPFLKLHFTASADGAAVVSGLKVRRGGITADSNIGEAYLYDGSDLATQLGRSTTISSGIITFSGLSISVPAGGSKDVMVRANLATPSASDSSKTISMSVEAADVTMAGSTVVSGSAMGNTMTISSVTDLGQAQFLNVTPTANNTVDPGQTGYELWRFKVTAADQDMIVKRVIFTQIGSVQDNALQNFKLMDGTTQLGSTVALMTSSKVSFDLSGMTNGGYKITNGQVKQLALVGDIIAGSGRTYRFSIQERTDAVVWDSNYQVYTVPAKGTTNAWAVVQPNDGATPEVAVSTTVNSGRLTISNATDSPSTNVPAGATAVTLAKWVFTAAGEDVKVDNLTAYCASNDNAAILKNVKLVLDGAQVGTTDSTQTCDGVAASGNSYTFGNSFVIPAGSTKTLSYVADLTDATIAADDTILASLKQGSSNAQGTVTLTSITTSAGTGRTVTVKSGALVTSMDASFSDRTAANPTGVLGAQGVKIGQFVVTGGGEAASVTQIVLTDDVAGAGSTLADTFQNLKLWKVNADGTLTQFGNTVGSLTDTDGTTYTFTPSTATTIAAGATQVFQITADIQSSGTVVTNDSIIYPSKVSATGVTTGTDVSDGDGVVTLQLAWIVTNGNLSVYPDSATPVRSTLVLGSTVNELARFKFDANVNEDINITKIVVSDVMTPNVAGAAMAATGTLRNLKLINVATGVQYGGTIASLDSSSTGDTTAAVAIFDNISNLRIPKSGSIVIKAVSDLSSEVDGGVSSSTHRLVIHPDYANLNVLTDGAAAAGGSSTRSVIATGADSGFSISTTSLDFNGSSANSNTDVYQVSGSAFDAFRTKLTIAKSSSSPTGVSSGADDQTVAIFVASNSANVGSYTATLKLLNLNIGSTISPSQTSTREMKVFKDSVATGNVLANTNANIGSGGLKFTSTAYTEGAFDDTDISAGGSRTYLATIDTQDATTDQRLTVGIGTAGIASNGGNVPSMIWSDGTTGTITIVDSLPITGNTLSY